MGHKQGNLCVRCAVPSSVAFVPSPLIPTSAHPSRFLPPSHPITTTANDQGNRTTPSYVAFTESERLIGDAAKNQVAMNASNTVFDAKRLIGRRFSDPVVQADMKHWPFTVVQGPGGKPLIQVTFKGETKTFAPEEISSMVLIKMREIAEAYLGKSMRKREGGREGGKEGYGWSFMTRFVSFTHIFSFFSYYHRQGGEERRHHRARLLQRLPATGHQGCRYVPPSLPPSLPLSPSQAPSRA